MPAPYVPREPRVWVEPYGSNWMLKCAVCGDVEQISGSRGYALSCRYDHKRDAHPTEEEQTKERVRAVLHGRLPMCRHCGRDKGHDPACPKAQPPENVNPADKVWY